MKNLKKFQGCLIGGAIGDALGYPIEFMRRVESIKEKYGENGITRFELKNGKARISDDTQMTLFTANGLLWNNTMKQVKGESLDITQCIYMAYKDWYNTQLMESYRKPSYNISWIAHLPELNVERAPGVTCLDSLANDKQGTIDEPLNNSKGCGGVMRVSPIGLFIDSNGLKDFSTFDYIGLLGAKTSALTHGHPLGNIPSYVLVILINILSHNDNITIEEALDISMKVYRKKCNIGDRKTNHYFIDLINKAKLLAHKNYNDIDAINALGEGWVAEETLAIALYSCIKYSNDFEKAIVCSVNHGGDSDSTGAVAGNIMGAYLGIDKIPDYYKEDLELKDEILEIATDLYTGYQLSNDQEWIKKYIYSNK